MINYYKILDWNRFIKNAHPLLKEWYNKELKFIKKLSGNILEVGSGTGRALKVLSKNCKRVVGIDKEKVMVDIAKRNLRNISNIEIYLRNAKNLKFPNNTFNSVICLANTFGNLGRDKIPILREMKRVCKKDGKIIISVYNEKALKPRLASYEKDPLTQNRVTRRGTVYTKEGLFSEQFTKKALEKIFSKVRLKCKITEFNPISYLCICKK